MKIEVKGLDKVIGKFETYKLNIGKTTEKVAIKISKYATKTYPKHAKSAGLRRWGGNRYSLFKDTKWSRKNKNTYLVKTPLHAVFQDQMHDHWVSLKKGRSITKWARSKGIRGGAIYVEAHPFIKGANKDILLNAKKIVKQESKRIIKK
jgi:hypothetical protein